MKRRYFAALPLVLVTQCAPQECAPVDEPPATVVEWTAGDCSSFAEEAAAAGVPWGIFSPIAWRESGCNPGVWVHDSDDNGGGLVGFNFITAALRSHWLSLCGATMSNIRNNVPLQMECIHEQYIRYGLSAWR